jgi:protein TonB
MSVAIRQRPLPQPTWRQVGPYLLLALLAHAALLAAPLLQEDTRLPEPRAQAVEVVLVRDSAQGVAPAPPAAAAPQSAAEPGRPRPTSAPSRVAAVTRTPAVSAPLLAIPGEAPAAPLAAGSAPAPPVAPAPAAAPPVIAARYDAAYLHNPRPAYPPISRRLGEEGRVLLRVRVGADGQPVAVDVEKSSNFERLDEAARRAVGSWRFVPARRGDEPVEGSVSVPLVFRLDE